MTETVEGLDTDRAYRAEGWSDSIAWRVIGPETEYPEPEAWCAYCGASADDAPTYCPEDRDGEHVAVYSEPEPEPTGRILAHMVGDDRPFPFDPEELVALDEDAYCSDCGQIGCGWGASR